LCPEISFGTKRALLKHVRDQHPDLDDPTKQGEKHKCQYCGHEYGTAGNRQEHEKGCKKNPKRVAIKCRYCPKEFYLGKYMMKHVRDKH
jgi:hypothetical protein